MTNRYDLLFNNPLALGNINTGTKTGLALGSVYVYATSGAAIGYKFVAPTSGNLTDVWFFVTAIAGTPGVTTAELRNIIVGTATKPGTTLHASQTVSPGTTINKWINIHFSTPYSVTQGVLYWIVIGDAGWTSGKTATIDYIGGIGSRDSRQGNVYTSADGFATAGTNQSQHPAIVLKFADGTLCGSPFTTFTTYANNTVERGLKIVGLTEDAVLSAIVNSSPAAAPTGMKIYKGITAPGGTTEVTITFGTGGSEGIMEYFAPFILRKNTIYRIVFTFGGNTTSPGYYQIEDYATGGSDLVNCGFGGGSFYSTYDGGSGSWVDNTDWFPRMELVFKDQAAIRHPASPFKGAFG